MTFYLLPVTYYPVPATIYPHRHTLMMPITNNSNAFRGVKKRPWQISRVRGLGFLRSHNTQLQYRTGEFTLPGQVIRRFTSSVYNLLILTVENQT